MAFCTINVVDEITDSEARPSGFKSPDLSLPHFLHQRDRNNKENLPHRVGVIIKEPDMFKIPGKPHGT